MLPATRGNMPAAVLPWTRRGACLSSPLVQPLGLQHDMKMPTHAEPWVGGSGEKSPQEAEQR